MHRPCLIAAQHDSSNFDCGEQTHNYFLKNKAMQEQINNVSFTYVVTEQKKIIAYYTLMVGAVMHEQALFPELSASGKKSLPILRISRLAVDKTKQKQKIAAHVLKDALSRACVISQEAGIRCLLVDAVTEDAQSFYRHFNFEFSPVDKLRMHILMKDVRKTLG